MKMRVWNGTPTLSSVQGKRIKSPQQLEAWLATQQDGQLEVWAGRWWYIARETRPFVWRDGRCFCDHPQYRSKHGLNPKDYSGFFIHEAYRMADRLTRFWQDIDDITGELLNSTDIQPVSPAQSVADRQEQLHE